ncbi:MAG TPA: thiolase family protein, partial [Solirubrobacterales bacterium]|nr:thiolase family protein [Solirubrobacterales bacterium]
PHACARPSIAKLPELMATDAFVLDALRTPIGRYRGALSGVRPDDLAALAIGTIVARGGLDPERIDDVFFGCANQAGEDNRNVARMANLLAELPVSVPGTTVNRLCASGLEAFNQAARAVRAGDADLCLAGGVESMTRSPWVLQKQPTGWVRGEQTLHDTTLGWRMINPKFSLGDYTEAMGETGENVAEEAGISREDQDEFALRSHQRAVAAWDSGYFEGQIVPVPTPPAKRGAAPGLVERDEGPRADTTLEALAKLRPAFREGGTVTAGNSSSLNDGAACLVVGGEAAATEFGLEPLARVVSVGVAAVEPRLMGLGPIPAIRNALRRAGLAIGDLDLVEINEAFASQVIACERELGIERERLNVNGGAIAIGHPLGCSGARLIGSLANELRRRGARYGVAALCVGVGQGVATIIENPSEAV